MNDLQLFTMEQREEWAVVYRSRSRLEPVTEARARQILDRQPDSRAESRTVIVWTSEWEPVS